MTEAEKAKTRAKEGIAAAAGELIDVSRWAGAGQVHEISALV